MAYDFGRELVCGDGGSCIGGNSNSYEYSNSGQLKKGAPRYATFLLI